jgi:hypothetical protein
VKAKKEKEDCYHIFIVKTETGGFFQFVSIVNVLALDMKTVADQYPSATSIDQCKGNIVVRPEVAKIICRQLKKSKKK